MSANAWIGFDVGGSRVKMVVLTGDGPDDAEPRRLAELTHELKTAERDREGIVACCASLAKGWDGGTIAAVGLAVPGPIRARERSVLKAANFPEWGTDFDFAAALAEAMHTVVAIENDANVFAYGEWAIGVAKGRSSVLAATLGTGIGGGLIVDGRLVQGARGFAGELGHVLYRPDGARCGCGARGCIEQYGSTRYLQREGAVRLPRLLEGVEPAAVGRVLAQAAREGEPHALGLFADMGRHLGACFAGILNVVDPEVLVLGGGLTETFDLFGETLEAEISERCFARAGGELEVLLARESDFAGAVGAALWARHTVSKSSS